MNSTAATETVVNHHLQMFLEQQGVDAIVADYREDARFFTEAKIYQGRQEIHGFFVDFLAALPTDALNHFTPRALRVDGSVAYLTWSVGSDIPLGTDTFVVDNDKIVSQTFAMYARSA